MTKERLRSSKRSRFVVRAPGAQRVCIAGTFNGWDPESHPMQSHQDGTWTVFVGLPSGRHEYKFVIDGHWCCEPGSDSPFDHSPDHVPNELGTMNRVIDVP